MGCALPGRQAGKQIFPIKAIGTTTHKLASATAGLHLRWNSNHEALECLEGRSNLTQAYPDFQIQPSKVTMFSCCMDSGKILLGSSIDIESDVALFVHLTRRDNVDELYECLLERSTGTFKRQQVSRYVPVRAVEPKSSTKKQIATRWKNLFLTSKNNLVELLEH